MKNPADKVASIKRATSDSGRADARHVAVKGAKVVLGGRRHGLLEEGASEIERAHGAAGSLAGGQRCPDRARVKGILRKRRPSARDERHWAAVVDRDAQAEFFYAVASTGVYCRPSCPSRRPLRKNVTFYETALAAELSGFRPCKRCRPRKHVSHAIREAAQSIVKMCEMLEESDTAPSLRELALHVGLSESHTHRLFARNTGLTPKQYRNAIMRERVHGELRASNSVTGAIYAAGFNASSRFYEHVARVLGMQPSEYRAGAAGLKIRFAVGECSLGSILVAETKRGMCAVSLGDEREALLRDLEHQFPRAELVRDDGAFAATVARVVGAVEADPKAAAEMLPIDIRGTVFQERVWRALRAVPRGRTTTYAEIAKAIAIPSASRAVARACAANRIAVLIPCHRVVRTDGSVSGYRWGVDRKRELLRREKLRDDAPR